MQSYTSSNRVDQRTDGVILQTLNFQDYDKIITVFSRDQGLIKLIVKGANRRNGKMAAMTTVLTRAEFVYFQKKSDLFTCLEISILDQYQSLRQDFSYLETACHMVQAIQCSQFIHTPAPDLYNLLLSYLERIPLMANPALLATSFRLKILRHDGILGLSTQCSQCGMLLKTYHIIAGECFCQSHSPEHSIAFSEEEMDVVFLLAYCQKFTQLNEIMLLPTLNEKLEILFKQMLEL